MKKLLALVVLAGSLAACNNGTDDGATSSDSAVLTTPSATDTSMGSSTMDSTSVAPMVDTTTAGTGSANSGGSGLGTTGTGTTAPADSVK